MGNQPRTHALVALMPLSGARLPARVDAEGHILRLKAQDRSRWDQAMLARGMLHLSHAATGEELTDYHLQAGIAACHCTAGDYESTDWPRIPKLYDRLVELDDSPIIALNRAVAVANLHEAQAGIEAVEAIRGPERLDAYYLLHAVLGEFEAQLDHFAAAASRFTRALQLTEARSEREFPTHRLHECEAKDSSTPKA